MKRLTMKIMLSGCLALVAGAGIYAFISLHTPHSSPVAANVSSEQRVQKEAEALRDIPKPAQEDEVTPAKTYLSRLRIAEPLAKWIVQVTPGVVVETTVYPSPDADTPALRVETTYASDAEERGEKDQLYRIAAADRLVVVTELAREELQPLLQTAGVTIFRELGPGVFVIDVPTARSDWRNLDKILEQIKGHPQLSVDKDYLTFPTVDASVPNDPFYTQQWGLADMKAPQAWVIASGNTATIVAVADTEIDLNHPDIAPNIFRNPGENGLDAQGRDKRTNGIDDDGNGYVDDHEGWDFGEDDNNPRNTIATSHGTHVAGIAAARMNNAQGIAGVAGNSRLLALKAATANGNTFGSALIAAHKYVAAMKTRANHNIVALNCSFSAYENGGDQLYREAIAMGNAGVNVVWAAGNSGINMSDEGPAQAYFFRTTKEWAKVPGVIAVGSSTAAGIRRVTSNYGYDTVHIFAPGENIYSTLPNAAYGYKTGTSMAAPQVTGALAVLRSANPNLGAEGAREALIRSANQTAPMDQLSVSNGRLDLSAGATLARDIPVVNFNIPDSTVIENAGAFTFVVSLDRPMPTPVPINLRFSGTAHRGFDFGVSAETITIPANTLSATFQVQINNDAVDEVQEFVQITGSLPSTHVWGTKDRVTIKINDDDSGILTQPTVSFSPVIHAVTEGETHSVELLLDKPAPYDLAIPVIAIMQRAGEGIPGVDYSVSPTDSVVRIPAGSQQGQLEIVALRDDIAEGPEVFVLRLPDTIPGAYVFLTLNNFCYVTLNDATNVMPVTVTLTDLSATYNGSPHPATVTTVPAGLTLNVTYDGGPTLPTNAGSYAAVATVTSPGYAGTATGTLVINKANQTITFAALPVKTYGDPPFTFTGSASSGLPVSYTSSNTPVATVSGSTATLVAAGSTVITASQAGNANYNPASIVTQTLTVLLGSQEIPSPEENLVPNGDFGSPLFAAPSYWINSDTHADAGWVAGYGNTKFAISAQRTLEIVNRGGFNAVNQILSANGLTGSLPFSFRARNSVAGGTTWLKVWGANGRQQVQTIDQTGPMNNNYQETGTLLLSANIGDSVYDWTEFTGTLNLGAAGYDYLVIKIYSTGGSGVTTVDNVIIDMPVNNLVPNGGFGSPLVAAPSYWINSDTHADAGWVAGYGSTKFAISAQRTLEIVNRGGFNAVNKILSANGLTGSRPFSFRARNSVAGGTTWLKVWGANGRQKVQTTDQTGPFNNNWQETGTLLLNANIGDSVYDWTEFTGTLNLGAAGYDYLVIKIYSNGGSGVTTVDSVIIDVPVNNLLPNGDFGSSLFAAPSYWINSDTHADAGWVAGYGSTKFAISAQRTLEIVNRGGFNAVNQILSANGLTGSRPFSFRARNSVAGGTTWLKVWGANGRQQVQTIDQTGPFNNNYQETGTLLLNANIGDSVYDWTEFASTLNLGAAGYDYLVIKIYNTGGSGVTAFDDVTIHGTPGG